MLSTLYFTGRVPTPLSMAEVRELERGGLALPVPVLARATAGGLPLVGTTPEYYEERGLAAGRGTLPVLLGDCALGAEAARRLGLGPGDRLLSDQRNLYDLSKGYPLRMRVAGVLEERGTADDGAVFCDLKTAWVVEGLGHGHGAAEGQPESAVIEREAGGVILNASVVEYTEITPENAGDFHFHGGPEELPVTGIIVVPRSDRARTQLKGRYRVSGTAQLVVPTEVMGELLGFVVRIKRFFDANALLVLVATGLLMAVIVALQVQVRRREIATLVNIGCARGTVARILGAELLLVIGAGALAAVVGAGAMVVGVGVG